MVQWKGGRGTVRLRTYMSGVAHPLSRMPTGTREPSWASEVGDRERCQAYPTIPVRGGDDGGKRQRTGGWSKLECGGLIWASATCQPPVAQWDVPRGLEHEAGEAVPHTEIRSALPCIPFVSIQGCLEALCRRRELRNWRGLCNDLRKTILETSVAEAERGC